ncbi:alpha/beta hydrolase-fold protein [Lactobacillus sp. LL6]|uniref:alpha/beta hydrolase n=1 Tax=Lactobacillus sp. LL6 TaxID=2596827 RepID=UPI0016426A7F|nr:alpha/beta hydrolase-fold protein [Lactobacillus sp. LL6]
MKKLTFPNELIHIPQKYEHPINEAGKLIDFYYDTYESFSYNEKKQKLHKHAVVYLPANYNKNQKYNVFYLMHGGWSNENTYLGRPGQESEFKNVLDNAIAEGIMTPMIVVCPTYNNLSPQDSSDYNLAVRLANNYHNELTNDLMPAIAKEFSTFAKSDNQTDIKLARDHHAFCGFSMGAVTTWFTFQYALDYFRYFMPSSGAITDNGELMAQMVINQNKKWNDFFIFAASGTKDFAYPSFTRQIQAMENQPMFRYANNEEDGNLYYLVAPGGVHGRKNALEDFYNGMIQLWK